MDEGGGRVAGRVNENVVYFRLYLSENLNLTF